MKKAILGLYQYIASAQLSLAQASLPNSTTISPTKSEQEIIDFSKEKWQWMSDKNVDKLGYLVR